MKNAKILCGSVVADGRVISRCQTRHRYQEWVTFLNEIKQIAPPGKKVHLICDNYSTHKRPKVLSKSKRNPRLHLHFTPTSASWLNMVERFCRDLNIKAMKRGSLVSVSDLIDVIPE